MTNKICWGSPLPWNDATSHYGPGPESNMDFGLNFRCGKCECRDNKIVIISGHIRFIHSERDWFLVLQLAMILIRDKIFGKVLNRGLSPTFNMCISSWSKI